MEIRMKIFEKKISDHKERIELAVANCKEYNPLVGVQFLEHPGDGIKIKVCSHTCLVDA